jgi:integrase/recombinase XerD
MTSKTTPRPEVLAYEGYLSRMDKAPATQARYLNELRPFLDWLGARSFGGLKAVEIDIYLDHWHQSFKERQGHPPAAATTRLHYTALRSFYNFLASRDLLLDEHGNPAVNRVLYIEAPKRQRKPIDALRHDEDAALLNYKGTANERFVTQLLRWTGIRAGEAQMLRICDLELTPGKASLHVRKSKTDNGLREVPLAPEFLPEIERWLAHQEARGLVHQNAPLLATRNGTPMQYSYIWRVVKRTAYKANVRPIACTCGSPRGAYHDENCPRTISGEHLSEVSPHTLRRTYATHLINKRMSLDVLSKLLGHSSVAVTQQHYAEILDPRARDAYLEALGYRSAA